MIERTQPVVTGMNCKGELVWGVVAMARWQMEMFRVDYRGDFMSFWMMRQLHDATGFESADGSSMDLSKTRKWNSKRSAARRRHHKGD